MRLILGAIMIVLVSADASAYTFALSKNNAPGRRDIVLTVLMAACAGVLREQTSNTTWLLPVGGPVECGTRCTDKTHAGLRR
jgi:hypothetical protein